MKTFFYIIFITLSLVSCSRKSEFEIVDYFIDSSDKGKFVFLFIKTDTIIASNIMKWASDFQNQDSTMYVQSEDILKVLIANFYTDKSITSIPEDEAITLRSKYQNNPGIVEKLDMASQGAIYTGFSRYAEGMPFPRDTVILTSVYIPKPGHKAIDIMKPNIE